MYDYQPFSGGKKQSLIMKINDGSLFLTKKFTVGSLKVFPGKKGNPSALVTDIALQ